MTASPPTAVEPLEEYDDKLTPLAKQLTIRMSAVAYANLVTRSLCESKTEGAIVRRWLWRGALAEGHDLQTF